MSILLQSADGCVYPAYQFIPRKVIDKLEDGKVYTLKELQFKDLFGSLNPREKLPNRLKAIFV